MQSTRENKSLNTQDQPTKASSVNSQNKKPHTSTNALNPSGETSPNALKHKHYPAQSTLYSPHVHALCELWLNLYALATYSCSIILGPITTISETSHIPLSAPSTTSNPTTTPHPPKELRVMPLKKGIVLPGAGFCIACNHSVHFRLTRNTLHPLN